MSNDTDQPDILPAMEDAVMTLPTRATNTAVERARTATDMRVVEVSDALAPAYAKASTLELTDAEVTAIMAPFPDSAVDIRPHDGLIFLSHINISDRLNAVFRPGKWALVCRHHWLEGGTLYGEYVLLIRGCFVGESVGGHLYQPNNPKTNYSDSLESTAAEALRRIAGKRLSCGSQVWHKDYAEKWVATFAEQVNGKWRKKTGRNAPPASAVANSRRPEPPKATPPQPQSKPLESASLTPQGRKDLLIGKLMGMEAEATQIMREESVILPTEDFTDIGLTTIELMNPDQMLALVKTIRQRKADNDQVPGAEVQRDEAEGASPEQEGTIEAVNAKEGKTKAGKPWVKYGVKIDGQWMNTFSKTLYAIAEENKGQRVGFRATKTDYGYDLLEINGMGEVTP